MGRVDHEAQHVVHDGLVSRSHLVARDEAVFTRRIAQRVAAVFVVVRQHAALGDGHEGRCLVVFAARQRRDRRLVERDWGAFSLRALRPGVERGDLRGGQRFVVVEGTAAAIVGDQEGRHGASAGRSRNGRSIGFHRRVAVELHRRNAP